MNAVVYYSNTGESRAVASYAAEQCGFPILAIEEAEEREYEALVLVFPVHCQSLPDAVARFLGTVRVTSLIAVATYGGMWHGNVLHELQKRYTHPLVGAAYFPTKHAYLDEASPMSPEQLLPLFEKLKTRTSVTLPRLFRNPLAHLFPRWRSRCGVSLLRTDACNDCGACDGVCQQGAIACGRPNGRCIRCLRCVKRCPQGALRIRLRLPMRLYLKKKKINELVLYT